MPVVGLGLDVCSVARIKEILRGPRAAKFLERVYTDAERALCGGRADAASGYAARFAAKEALVKALAAPPGIRWRDMEVVRDSGAPSFKLTGVAAQVVRARQVSILLALTHDAGVAAATVILQS